MSEVPPPDWAALYQQHREAMYRVATGVLHRAERADWAGDAVMAAMVSLIKSPPVGVLNWEAVLVMTAKRRALDILRSAPVKHELSADESRQLPDAAGGGLADEVAELVDRRRAAAVAWDKLALLDVRDRKVVWEYIALERPRQQVAAELGVTPARISQIATKALRTLREALESEGVQP